MRDILIIAGEASGDLHAAGVARQLRVAAPGVRLVGVGGQRMAESGVELFERTAGVVGFVEVLRHLPAHWRLLRQVTRLLQNGRVGLAILVDYGGFNLRAAAVAHAAGVPVLYYVTPQVWASRPERMRRMARVVTRAAVILPFEEELLRANDIDATFVGHPLLDHLAELPSRAEARARLGFGENDAVLALFPGSRPQEIARHAEGFTAVARDLIRRRPGLNVVVSAAGSSELRLGDIPHRVVHGASFDVLRAADAALCKSGTTTIEAAIAGCPSAIVYRVNPLTYAIVRRIVTVRHIGLVNIVAGKDVVPEFVQDAFVPGTVADALEPLLDASSPARARMVEGLADVRARLGTPGASGRVAAMALGMLR
ncbi:MAG: lipid-A-disaccharide synthase [Gemmatimonadaceae bacterium]|nr:lipid-A-disaccharide synthase [Gemmatimonadaceae bacterium]